MEINYQENKLYENNLFLSISKSSIEPTVILHSNPNLKYTLVMFDPEAVGGNKIHWLITNVTENDIRTGNILIKYKGPEPPRGSGKHHYVFCLFAQSEPIQISDIKFSSRFIELNKLFIKLKVNQKNFALENIIFFVSENIYFPARNLKF